MKKLSILLMLLFLISDCKICQAENFSSEFQKAIKEINKQKGELDREIKKIRTMSKDFQSFDLKAFPIGAFKTAKGKKAMIKGRGYVHVILRINKKNIYVVRWDWVNTLAFRRTL